MTNHQGAWLTIREAALQLGTSELTIRRRIKDGRLQHRLEQGKYFVLVADREVPEPPKVDEPAAERHPNGNGSPAPAEYAGLDLNAFLAEHARLAELAGRAHALEQQLRDVEKRNDELHQGLVTLAGRNGWLESRLEERERDIKLLADSRKQVSWWRRPFSRVRTEEPS